MDYANGVELDDLTAAFLELRDALKQLQWYGLVNLNKIVSRLAKLGGNSSPPGTVHLAAQTQCLKDLEYVNDMLAGLQSRRQEARRDLTETSLLWQKYRDELPPSLPLTSASSAINRGDALILDQILEHSRKEQVLDERTQQLLLFALLHLSTLNGSKGCIEILLSRIASLQEFGEHLHWLVIKIGRMKKFQARELQIQNVPETTVLGLAATEAIDQLAHVIHRLGFLLRAVLHKKDLVGRLPLHHAVQYGLYEICREILKYMKGDEVDCSSIDSDPALLPDSEGLSALGLAVLTGNAAITELLLEDLYHSKDVGTNTNNSHVHKLPSNLLTTALKLRSFAIVQLLRPSIVDINYRDYNNETALYIAVRSGRLEYVIMLLGGKHDEIDLDVPEATYGWTPLILASINGDLPVVELLLRAGADPKVQDAFGWTVKDHAAFRGHLPMAKMLKTLEVGSIQESLQINHLHRMEQRTTKLSRSFDYPRDFNRNIPPGYSQIFVNLGPLDSYKAVTAVNLSPYVYPDIYNPQRETEFQVEVRAIGEDQPSHVIQLPILEDMANKPWLFLTENVKDFKLAFNIFHASTGARERGPLIGSAIALLESLKQGLGSKRESLIRDFTIPVLQADTLRFIGTVTFYFLVITPFPHPGPVPGAEMNLGLRNDDSPTIIGHRGSFQSFV